MHAEEDSGEGRRREDLQQLRQCRDTIKTDAFISAKETTEKSRKDK